MARRDSYAPGTPSWVDLAVDDLEGARAFYTELFGWEADVSEDPAVGGYTTFRQDGLAVAGVGGKMGPPMPDAWSVHMSVADAAQALAAVADAGGQVVAGPMPILDEGVLGIFADPNGTFAGVWEAKAHTGAELVNVPNTFCWSELATGDIAAAVAFYTTVFGWQAGAGEGEGMVFTDAAGRALCGVHVAGEQEFPAWSVWFAVEDCDSTVDRVTSAGGQVFMPPTDMGFGRGSVVAAPGGAVFGVAALTAPDD